MFAGKLADAIGDARSLAQCDEISRTLWQAGAAGHIEDDDAQRLAERLEAVRKGLRPSVATVGTVLAGSPSSRPAGFSEPLSGLHPLNGSAALPPPAQCLRP